MKRVHVWVRGKVQGVFFRATTRKEAESRSVTGWVRNLDDGRVEAVFEGFDFAVDAMVDWCHDGSPAAVVEEVEAVEEEETGEFDAFIVR